MSKELVDFCQMFLVPTSILIAAIAIAETEWLKALISVIGAGIGALWCYRVYEWPGLTWPDQVTTFGMGLILGGAAAISALAHFIRATSNSLET